MTRETFGATTPGCCPDGQSGNRQIDLPDKANCTTGRHEPHGYQGLPKGSVRKGYFRNLGAGSWRSALITIVCGEGFFKAVGPERPAFAPLRPTRTSPATTRQVAMALVANSQPRKFSRSNCGRNFVRRSAPRKIMT